MERHKWAAQAFGSLFVALAANANAATIHDVYVLGVAVQGTPVGQGTTCVELSIGTTGGTDYGNLIIQGAVGDKPATIRAIENNASCFGMTVDAIRDRLLLVNTRIIPKSGGVNIDLTIEYRGDFGPNPNGSVVFGGYMKGKFIKNNVGVTCTGNTPPNGPCKSVYDTGVVSPVGGPEYPLPEISTTNPLGGSFNVNIPASSAINVGSLNRGLHAIVTTKLPTINHSLEIKAEDVILGPPVHHRPEALISEVGPAIN